MRYTTGSGVNNLDYLFEGRSSKLERTTEGSCSKSTLVKNTNANIARIVESHRGVLTGSRAWNKHKKLSDWDYVVTPDMYTLIID
jgi:hypothetical protein